MTPQSTPLGLLNRIARRLVPLIKATALGVSITADQAFRHTVVSNVGATAAITVALPAARPGMRVTAIVKAAYAINLDPNGTETVSLPSSGVQGTAGQYLSGDAVGESVELICIVAGTWDAIGPIDGTWTLV